MIKSLEWITHPRLTLFMISCILRLNYLKILIRTMRGAY